MTVSIEQPDPGAGGEEDTSDVPEPDKEFKTQPGDNKGVPTTNWGGTVPDSTNHRQSPPTTFPGVGTSDTLSPASSSTPRSAGTATSTTSSRRGLLGIHPIALIAGLIALHVFVVTVAGK